MAASVAASLGSTRDRDVKAPLVVTVTPTPNRGFAGLSGANFLPRGERSDA